MLADKVNSGPPTRMHRVPTESEKIHEPKQVMPPPPLRLPVSGTSRVRTKQLVSKPSGGTSARSHPLRTNGVSENFRNVLNSQKYEPHSLSAPHTCPQNAVVSDEKPTARSPVRPPNAEFPRPSGFSCPMRSEKSTQESLLMSVIELAFTEQEDHRKRCSHCMLESMRVKSLVGLRQRRRCRRRRHRHRR